MYKESNQLPAAHEKLPLPGLSWIAFPEKYSPIPHWLVLVVSKLDCCAVS